MGYLDKWGGRDSYADSQRSRYKSAIESGDTDLKSRLERDAERVGYSLNQGSGYGGQTDSKDSVTVRDSSGRTSRVSRNNYVDSQIERAKAIQETGTDPWGSATMDKINEDLKRFGVDLDNYLSSETQERVGETFSSTRTVFEQVRSGETGSIKQDDLFNTGILILVGFFILKLFK